MTIKELIQEEEKYFRACKKMMLRYHNRYLNKNVEWFCLTKMEQSSLVLSELRKYNINPN